MKSDNNKPVSKASKKFTAERKPKSPGCPPHTTKSKPSIAKNSSPTIKSVSKDPSTTNTGILQPSTLLKAALVKAVPESILSQKPTNTIKRRLQQHSPTERNRDLGNLIEVESELSARAQQEADKLKNSINGLLNDHEFKIDNADELPANDITRILTYIPFELRKEAYARHIRGIRHFGKLPWPAIKPKDSPINQIPCFDQFRHISCPEGPGENAIWGLAWIDGPRFGYVSPYTSKTNDPIPTTSGAPQASSFTNELSYEIQHYNSVISIIEKHISHQQIPPEEIYYAHCLLDTANHLQILDPTDKHIAKLAFAFGIMYAKNILYPKSLIQESDIWLSKENSWKWIIILAISRHGHNGKPNRKELLELLGCTNAHDYSKDSNSILKFDPQYSACTPKISCRSYDKAYKSANNFLNSSDSRSQDSIINDYLSRNDTRRGKTQSQKNRLAKQKFDAEAGKKAAAEDRKKIADNMKREEQYKLAQKRIKAAKEH